VTEATGDGNSRGATKTGIPKPTVFFFLFFRIGSVPFFLNIKIFRKVIFWFNELVRVLTRQNKAGSRFLSFLFPLFLMFSERN
jgi:hypothetical protein